MWNQRCDIQQILLIIREIFFVQFRHLSSNEWIIYISVCCIPLLSQCSRVKLPLCTHLIPDRHLSSNNLSNRAILIYEDERQQQIENTSSNSRCCCRQFLSTSIKTSLIFVWHIKPPIITSLVIGFPRNGSQCTCMWRCFVEREWVMIVGKSPPNVRLWIYNVLIFLSICWMSLDRKSHLVDLHIPFIRWNSLFCFQYRDKTILLFWKGKLDMQWSLLLYCQHYTIL